MKTRCNNPRFKDFKNYGGRGIGVCERWDEFANFLEDMGPTFAEGLTLDRIDCNGDYAPENCRWADHTTQANNTRSNVFITLWGESHTLTEWCRLVGLPIKVVQNRYYNYGWDVERCLTTPVRAAAKRKTTK